MQYITAHIYINLPSKPVTSWAQIVKYWSIGHNLSILGQCNGKFNAKAIFSKYPAWTQLRYEDATRAVTDVVELNPLVLRALVSMGIFAMMT
jgi:hypothetical protein